MSVPLYSQLETDFQVSSPFSLSDTTTANSYYAKAAQFSAKSKYDSSNIYYEKASLIYEKVTIGTDSESIWTKYLMSYNNMGWNSARLVKLEKAESYLNKAMEIGLKKFGENHNLVALINNTYGYVYKRKGDYDKALEHAKKFLEISLSLFGPNHARVADGYNSVGVIYDDLGEYEKSYEYYNKSLALRIRLLGENHAKVANLYNNIGVQFRAKGDFDKALQYQKKALNIRLKVLNKNHPAIALSYNNLGYVYWEKGDYYNALKFHNKALELRRLIYGKDHPAVAYSYVNIGNVYALQGDSDTSIEYQKRALAIFFKVYGNKNHPDIATIYHNIGTDYGDKEDHIKAIEFQKKALAIRREVFGEDHILTSGIYNNLGAEYRNLGDLDSAIYYHKRSLAIKLKLFKENHPEVARSYQNIGHYYTIQKKYDLAIEFYKKALFIRKQKHGDKHPSIAQTHLEFGKLFHKKGDFNKALTSFQNAIIALVSDFDNNSIYTNPPLIKISSTNNLLSALELKAEILRKKYFQKTKDIKDLEFSLETYSHASELVDQIRRSYKSEGSKLFLGQKAVDMFGKGIKTALDMYVATGKNKYKNQAFAFSEKAKAALLWESIVESQAHNFSGIPDSLLQRERELRIDLTFYNNKIEMLKDKTSTESALKIRQSEEKVFSMNREYEALVEQFEKQYPKYYELKYQPRGGSVTEIQEQLKSDVALVEYFLTDSTLYIFLVDQKEFIIKSLPLKADLETEILTYYRSLKHNNKNDFIKSSSSLYNLLITPVKKNLSSTKKLIIIPDGNLHYIPFEALISDNIHENMIEDADYSKLSYLINEFEIAYHHSAGLYINNTNSRNRQIPKYDFGGFAPVFSSSNEPAKATKSWLSLLPESIKPIWELILRDGEELIELPFSEKEISSIDLLFKQNNKRSLSFINEEASEHNFKKSASIFNYVQLATHSFINRKEPKLSGIAFSQPSDSTKKEDGILYAGEIYNLQMNAKLIVLSSCESGLGEVVKGEGIMAMPRGFLYAGVKNIMASLWKVSDSHTARFMEIFYKDELKTGDTSKALQAAKLAFIKNPKTAFPLLWSSFILVGQ